MYRKIVYPDRPLTRAEIRDRYYKKHREEICAKQKRERKATGDLDRLRQRQKIRRRSLAARNKANHKRWRDKNRKRLRIKSRAYYAANTAAFNKRTQAWRKKYPIKSTVIVHRRLARKRKALGSHTSQQLVDLLKSQKNRCANTYCRCDLRKHKKALDHKKPLSRGGSNGIKNLQWLCTPCNCRKSDLTLRAWIAREAERAELAE